MGDVIDTHGLVHRSKTKRGDKSQSLETVNTRLPSKRSVKSAPSLPDNVIDMRKYLMEKKEKTETCRRLSEYNRIGMALIRNVYPRTRSPFKNDLAAASRTRPTSANSNSTSANSNLFRKTTGKEQKKTVDSATVLKFTIK